MREIKFRAWDKQEKKYYEPVFTAYKGDLDDMMINFNGDLCKHTLNSENGSMMVHESLFPDRFILEQYTGLKDKNGKEIYEGDILQYMHGYESCIYTVSSILELYYDVRYSEEHSGLGSFTRKDIMIVGHKVST